MNESVTGTGRGVPAHRGPGRVTFWGSLCAELLKLRGLVSTWVLMGLLMVGIPVVAAIVAAVVRFGGVSSTSSAVMFWTYFGSALGNMILVAGVFGVMAVTTEFTTRSIQSSLLAVPRRLTFMGSKLLAVGLYVMAAAFVGVTLGALSTLLVSGGAGLFDLSFRDLRLPVIVMLGGPAALVLVAIMAAGLGGVCRFTVGGVLALIGVFSILPTITAIAAVLLSKYQWMVMVFSCLPDQVFKTFLRGGAADTLSGSVSSSFTPNWWQSGIILVLWTVVFSAIGVMVVRRSDVK